jgi:hypothetical protein
MLAFFGVSYRWYTEDVFRIVLSRFEQLYTLYGLEGNSCVLLVCALLENKRKVKELVEVCSPHGCMTFFCMSMINVLVGELIIHKTSWLLAYLARNTDSCLEETLRK